MTRFLRRLLRGLRGDASPAIAPRRDGSVYVAALHERRAVPGSLRRLSPPGDFGQPMITRCGNRVAWWGTDSSRDGAGVWIGDLDGTAVARRVTGGAGIQGHPYWHPDGRRLVHFASQSETWDPKRQFSTDRSPSCLCWLDLDTGESTPLTEGPYVDERPAVAPDGGTVVFVSNRSGRMNLWRVGADGTRLAQLTDGPGPDYRPCISPDGRMLAYFSPDERGAHQVRLRVLATGDELPCDWTVRFRWSHGPFWCADNRSLLLHAVEAGARSPALWWVHLPDGTVEKLDTIGIAGASHGTVDCAERWLTFDCRD